MAKQVEEVLEDPDAIVEDAIARADAAQDLVTAIENRIISDDPTATHEELAQQISVARFAAKVVEGARTKAAGIRAEQAVRDQKSLAAEALRRAPEDGALLLDAVDRAIAATRDVMKYAGQHDEQLSEWVNRARALGVPDKGVSTADFAGLAVSAGGDLLVGDVVIRPADGKNILRLLFTQGAPALGGGLIPADDPDLIDAARAIAANMGKAAV